MRTALAPGPPSGRDLFQGAGCRPCPPVSMEGTLGQESADRGSSMDTPSLWCDCSRSPPCLETKQLQQPVCEAAVGFQFERFNLP